jgi:hypothetical protein
VITLVIGRRELGKSTLSMWMATRRPYSVLLDPRHLFESPSPVGDLTAIGMEDLEDRMEQPAPVSVVVQPDDYPDRASEELAKFTRRWTIDRSEQLSVVLDESAQGEGQLYSLDYWGWHLRCHPRHQLDLILNAHRPKDIPTTWRSLADNWCVFRTTQEHDLEVLEARCGTRFVEAVSKLLPRHFAVWNDAKSEWSLRTNPAAWYVPLRDQSAQSSETMIPGDPVAPKVGLF